MGIVIRGTSASALSNVICEVKVNHRSISSWDDSEEIKMGIENYQPFEDFDLFQVRSFNFNDYDQYKWEIRSRNSTIME